MKVALVYDRVNKWGGAERVLLALHEMYPEAPLFTSVYDKKGASWAKVFPEVKTSFLQKIPFAKSNHEFLAPLMPLAFESFDFTEFDLVISVTSEFAKGITTAPGATHICYCLTPTRYLWSGYGDYFSNYSFRVITKPIIYLLRKWDIKASTRPNIIVAISSDVQKRIKKYYKRNSEIVFPPVDVKPITKKTGKYHLLVSRLDFGYKKVNLAVEAFSDLKLPLVIVGSGRLLGNLQRAANKNIRFVGRVSETRLLAYYQNAKALIMPQEEDFGIVAVEAQSLGVPVIAYKNGGANDTVIDGVTGVLFEDQTANSLKNAILMFEKTNFKADNLITNAKKFSKKNFKLKFGKIVNDATKRQ